MDIEKTLSPLRGLFVKPLYKWPDISAVEATMYRCLALIGNGALPWNA